MNSESDLEYSGKIKAEKLTSFAEDFRKEQAEIISDREHWKKYGTNRSRESTLSKREITEELSRERFPWEE